MKKKKENDIFYDIRGASFSIHNTYLRLSDKKLGLLIIFNSSTLNNAITRIVNNL